MIITIILIINHIFIEIQHQMGYRFNQKGFDIDIKGNWLSTESLEEKSSSIRKIYFALLFEQSLEK